MSEYYDDHYRSLGRQPIEVMQDSLTHQEFIGFLKGQVIKYSMRAGHKEGEPAIKDRTKMMRYRQWLSVAMEGRHVNPLED